MSQELIITEEFIVGKILLIRNKKVMIDVDLYISGVCGRLYHNQQFQLLILALIIF